MAEPHEQNQGVSGVSPPEGPQTAVPSGVAVRHFPGEEKGPEQVYSALSIMAMVGFGIGVVYANVIVVLAGIAFFNHRPLLLTSWTALFPLSAILLCAMARFQIKRSEGTLAGDGLARWGLLLSLFVGLCYFAYLAAIAFAVRQQARAYADAWLEQLRKGDVTEAAVMMLPPLMRLSLKDLREDDPERARTLETLMSGSTGGGPGSMMNLFRQHQTVRMLMQAGPDAHIECKGVKSWRYTAGGYEVVLNYAITTPESESDLVVTVHGSNAPRGEYERREWFVLLEKTRLDLQSEGSHLTEKGETALRLAGRGSVFLSSWEVKLSPDTLPESYLLTLPEPERARVRKNLDDALRLGAVAGPLIVAGSFAAETAERYGRYLGGALVEVDAKQFLAEEKTREELAAEVRRLFLATKKTFAVQPGRSQPLRSRVGDKLLFAYDMSIMSQAGFAVECIFEVECDARALDSPEISPGWRLVRILLVGGKKRGAVAETGHGQRPSQPQVP